MCNRKSLLVFLVIVVFQYSSAVKIQYPGCDRQGWKCIKVQASPIKYLIEFVCPNSDGVNFALWNFNAPVEIRDLKIVNCTSVEIDMTCTNVGRQIESLHITNVGILNFTNIIYKDVAQMPEKVIFENIKLMPLIPEKTFKQMKAVPASSHRCAANTKPTNSITFKNVNIHTVQQNAFHNLTEMSLFTWKHVNITKMEPLALQVEMEKDKSFLITDGIFGELDYKVFSVKSSVVKFEKCQFESIPTYAIDTTAFQFNFLNNTVRKVNPFAFLLLSKDITFNYNTFDWLKTSALQGIGPGLLENALMSFGELKFTYNFNNNTILHADIGGLHSDWIAYKNVRSYIYVTNNFLPCSCKELGWLTLRNGLGEEFSRMMKFNSKFLDVSNNNLCLNAACDLPVSVMANMHIKFGVCGETVSLLDWCEKFNPNNTKEFPFGQTGNIIMEKWQNDIVQKLDNRDETAAEEDLEDMLALKEKSNNIKNFNSENMVHFFGGKPKENYIKIESKGFADANPLKFLGQLTNTDNLLNADVNDQPTVENNTMSPLNNSDSEQIVDNEFDGTNRIDVRVATNDTSTPNNEFTSLKNEYDEEQKKQVKQSYEDWRVARKKRMIYFKLYGNLMTLE